MTAVVVAPCTFRRDPRVLWRSSAQDVVLLPPGREADCLLLTGSGVALWRALSTPATLDDLVALLEPVHPGATAESVRAAVEHLVSLDVVQQAP